MFDSRQEAIKLFKKIIDSVKVKDFFSQYWEKKPLLIKRKIPTYYDNWISCHDFDEILRNNDIEFTTNIDIVSYINGVKSNHNPAGRAYAPLVWDLYQQGCSVRFLNPQTYSKNIWNYLSTLQELFGTKM
jgi:bifunctional lysine-specific demethylase and histidyl-hydroxylase NO66